MLIIHELWGKNQDKSIYMVMVHITQTQRQTDTSQTLFDSDNSSDNGSAFDWLSSYIL